MNDPSTQWAVALFHRSVLKQAKYHRLLELMDDPVGRTSLDIGADNGVISYLLRQRGGRWYSADLDPGAVASIRDLVQEDVYQLDGRTTPFPDQTFDQVVIVDFLEHIPDDRAFVRDPDHQRAASETAIVTEPVPPSHWIDRRVARAPSARLRG
jgi:2-polyprenyl-3-methyl-5-hydroxy-6-metoxy-1,4-benzoquinol methylase